MSEFKNGDRVCVGSDGAVWVVMGIDPSNGAVVCRREGLRNKYECHPSHKLVYALRVEETAGRKLWVKYTNLRSLVAGEHILPTWEELCLGDQQVWIEFAKEVEII